MMNADKSILILGRPASGKTTYLAQFLTRAKRRKGVVKLLSMPENIKAISDAQRSLANGKEPATTQSDKNVELNLEVDVDGTIVQLNCPDYGGEQLASQTSLMEITDKWQKLVNSSNNWLLFIRSAKVMPEYDLSVSSYEYIEKDNSSSELVCELSDQCLYIELIQGLLHAKGHGTLTSIKNLRLTVVLTCWDELETEQTPKEVLIEKLPMFSHVIEALWSESELKVMGLSAQEFPLDSIEAEDKYLDLLPESFGYIVNPDGSKDKDLTKLIKNAM